MSDNRLFFNKVAIIGVGLLGASFALALKEKGLCKTICGNGRKEENLKRAKGLGIIDDFSLDIDAACRDADLILLATPVGVFKDIASKIKGTMKKDALFTDVGSVKGKLVYELEALMPSDGTYVGSHPIAGSEKSGIEDARPDLFNNAKCIVTPTDRSAEDTIKSICALWTALGSKVELMDPYRHDEIYAAVSHFPHLIAYTIVNMLDDLNPDYIDYAGQGFRDTTRIALSSPALWRDITMLNRENVLKLIDIFKGNLDKISASLRADDAAGIKSEFLNAQTLRKRLK